MLWLPTERLPIEFQPHLSEMNSQPTYGKNQLMAHRIMGLPGFHTFLGFFQDFFPQLKIQEIKGNLEMPHPWGPLISSYIYMFDGIKFLNAVVGTQLLVALLVASIPILQPLQLMEECSTSQQNACMVWMGYSTSWVNHIRDG